MKTYRRTAHRVRVLRIETMISPLASRSECSGAEVHADCGAAAMPSASAGSVRRDIQLLRALTDEAHYRRDGNRNHLLLVRRIAR